ncbi:MAG TPA: heme A synthase [Stenomitos sp.]
MADSFLSSPTKAIASATFQPLPVIRKAIYGLSFATLILMAIGSATRVMNAGLACPDWPLCYGTLVPADQMNLQVFLEWFHRLVATTIGFTMIGLTTVCWVFRRSLPGWLPISVTFSLGLIVLQGILGGLTVTQLLRFDIVTAHLGVGLLFFSSMVTMASFLTPYQGTGGVGNLPIYSAVAAGCIYLQSILGALVASRWAVHQCLDVARLCQVLNSHMISAVPVSLAVLFFIYRTWRTAGLHPWLRRMVQFVLLLLTAQVSIGVATLRLHLQVEWLTVSHQAIAALLFGTLIGFSILAFRDRQQMDRFPLSTLQEVPSGSSPS